MFLTKKDHPLHSKLTLECYFALDQNRVGCAHINLNVFSPLSGADEALNTNCAHIKMRLGWTSHQH